MRHSQLLYIRLAVFFIICSFFCYILKVIRIPGDETIVRAPDVTLHDIVYFNAENFVNLCGLIAFTNVSYFALSCYPKSTLIGRLTNLLIAMTCVMFCRCIGNVITYYIVTPWEIGADVVLCILSLLLINKPSVGNATHSKHSVLS